MERAYSDSIFWVETEKIKPNPYQPRRDFDEHALRDLADSIRQYGVLQPLVVTRREIVREDDGGLFVEYELIAGERRLRASKLAGLPQVPVLIRTDADNGKIKLELAIIENLQREDLNAIDRANAFLRLHQEFGFSHGDIGKKMGKSREYVSNTLRLLGLPEYIRMALSGGKITEGHTRPLMMLADRPEEQATLFKEITIKKMSVREAELIARGIAKDRARKKDPLADPTLISYQEKLAESLGTRVHIEKREVGGKIVIDFFSPSDLESIFQIMKSNVTNKPSTMLEKYMEQTGNTAPTVTIRNEELAEPEPLVSNNSIPSVISELLPEPEPEAAQPLDDRSTEEKHIDENTDDSDLYKIGSFTV